MTEEGMWLVLGLFLLFISLEMLFWPGRARERHQRWGVTPTPLFVTRIFGAVGLAMTALYAYILLSRMVAW